jgi:energy-converting hydrogenase Eha subunit E
VTTAIFVGLLGAYIGACVMTGVRRDSLNWHWAVVGVCLALAGWTFMPMNSPLSSLMWLGFGGYWAFARRRRVVSLRRQQAVRWW